MADILAQPGLTGSALAAVRPAWLSVVKDTGVVITVNSNKGGVGKTTVVLMLAYYLADYIAEVELDVEILLVDWDPQCNLSTCLGFHMDGADGKGVKDEDGNLIRGPLYSADDVITASTDEAEPGSAAGMIEPIRWVIRGANGAPIKRAVTGEDQPDPINPWIKLLPGHPAMEKRYTLISEADFRFRLDYALQGVKKGRIVLVDTGPGMGPLVECAWAASDHVLGVTPLYYNEMEGTLKARNKVRAIRKSLQRPELDMDGIIVNEYVRNRGTQRINLAQLIDALGEDRIWIQQAVPEVEQIAKVVDQGKSFGRLQGSFNEKKKINDAGKGLAAKVLEVIGGA
jgi:chromosome partitioning protein